MMSSTTKHEKEKHVINNPISTATIANEDGTDENAGKDTVTNPITTATANKDVSDLCTDSLLQKFKSSSNGDQLSILTSLLRHSSPEVKYHFQLLIEEITMYDILSEIPREISEKIILMLDFTSLLKCRQVCHTWNILISQCNAIWLHHLHNNGIDNNSFHSLPTNPSPRTEDTVTDKNLDVIGAGMKFDITVPPKHPATEGENCFTIESDSYFKRYVRGRRLVQSFKQQAGFHHIVDHDCVGSNLLMAMNDEILVYAREDRHICVKYANFPHKKICVFEAQQVASMKIINDKIVCGGYNRVINIFYWETGYLYCTLEGSIKPVLSLDVMDNLLVSSDGKSVITWDIIHQEMLVKWPVFDDDGIVEEIVLVNPNSNEKLSAMYEDLILITRSYHQIKLWLLFKNGTLKFLTTLQFHKDIHHYQPFIHVTDHVVSCSSEYGVITWDITDFSYLSQTHRKPCKTCQFTSEYCRHTRVLLLYRSRTHIIEYFVFGNYFRLIGLQSDNPDTVVKWNYPSHEKWPWAHRKPGLACLISGLEDGFSEHTKITMFVATQDKKIYCMIFDASDAVESGECSISEVLSGSRTWNSLIDD